MDGKVLESIMIICFGMAWPVSVYKSFVTRSAVGKSPLFLAAILLGYLSGITAKLIVGVDYVLVFYLINLVMVLADVALYFRNRALDTKRLEGGVAVDGGIEERR